MREYLEAYAKWMDDHIAIYGITPQHMIAIGLIGMAVGLFMIWLALPSAQKPPI